MSWQCFLSIRFSLENYRRISHINLLLYWLCFITQQSGSLDLRTEYSVDPDFATLWAAWVESSHLSSLTFSFFICDVRKVEIIDWHCSVQSVSCVRLFVTPRTVARQASLFILNSWSLLKLMAIESVMPSNHFILCCSLLLLPSIFPSIRVFSNESILHSRWPKYWSFSFSISPSSEYSGLISFRMDWLDLLVDQGTTFYKS